MSSIRPYSPAVRGDSRSPCPALNALANHSYIPHSGRTIPFVQLVNALRAVYSLSLPLALLLTIVGFLWCGHWTKGGYGYYLELDLHDLALHNHIEHDGSLGHADAQPGEKYAPVVPDTERIDELLDAASATLKMGADKQVSRGLTLSDLIRVRFVRERALSHPLDIVHGIIARGEIALIYLAMGGGGVFDSDHVVPTNYLDQWFREDRLPYGWKAPSKLIGLLNVTFLAQKVNDGLTKLSRSG